jgi:hypothetical protein
MGAGVVGGRLGRLEWKQGDWFVRSFSLIKVGRREREEEAVQKTFFLLPSPSHGWDVCCTHLHCIHSQLRGGGLCSCLKNRSQLLVVLGKPS